MRTNLVGQQIGRYQVEQFLASGGMADVFLAQDIDLERPVALKVMDSSLTADSRYIERFQREARTVAKLNHPNIVQIYATGVTPDGHPYLAMQYVAGGSLSEKLFGLAEQRQLMETGRALAIIRPIVDALATAHSAEIIHRDLKPGNILLSDNGKPILVDLGIASTSGGARLTQTGAIIGTPHYMSPEQVKGEPLDGRSDLYSLGIILYEMLTGHVPFDAPESIAVLHMQVYDAPRPIGQVRPGLTPQLEQIVTRCLAKAPDDRYGSAGELVHALDLALSAEAHQGTATVVMGSKTLLEPQFTAPPPSSSTTLPPTTKERSGGLKWLLVLIPLLLMAGLFFAWRANLLSGASSDTLTTAAADPTVAEIILVITNTPPPATETPLPAEVVIPTETPSETPSETPLPSATPLPTAEPLAAAPAVSPLSGSSLVQVTSDSANEYELNLSPDQRTATFFSDRDGSWQVYTADPDGGPWQQLTFGPAEHQHPHFSPDGERIVYTSDETGKWEIYSMTADGRDPQRLTFHDNSNIYGLYSSDGEWITFMSRQGKAWGIYRMRPDGSDIRVILDTPKDETFAMMLPDGQQVVLQSNTSGTHGIYLVDVNGNNMRPLFDSSGRDANPVVSPDGQWIAFESDQSGDYDIYVIRPDGSGLQNVTNKSSRDQLPFFSPDGQWLLYQSRSGNDYNLFRQPFDLAD